MNPDLCDFTLSELRTASEKDLRKKVKKFVMKNVSNRTRIGDAEDMVAKVFSILNSTYED